MPTAEQSLVTVPMPRLSDSMEEGVVVRWLVGEGSAVERGQEVVEIETDKATMGFEAPAAGPLWFLVGEGDTVAVGEPIAEIGERSAAPAGKAEEPAPAEPSSASAAGAEPDRAQVGDATDDGPKTSPVARRLARDLGVDLTTVSGSGPGGRIVKQDVLAAAESGGPAGALPANQLGAPAVASAIGARGPSRRLEPTRSQATVARRMGEAKATVPEFPVQIEIEIEAAVELRRQLKTALDPAPTLNDLLVAAVARTLVANPRLNAAYLDAGFELFEEVNVGVAVAADDELLVPVVRGADRLSLVEIATQSRRLVERTRSGAITPPELAGGTFTVSNLGMFGIHSFQPILNPPQAAILGVGGLSGGAGRPSTLGLTLVSDHRIVYGAHAAKFLADLRDLLATPASLLVGG